jgi:hypothetical protein
VLRDELSASQHEQERLRYAIESTKGDAVRATKAARAKLDEYAARVRDMRAEHVRWAEERTAGDAAEIATLRETIASLSSGRCPRLHDVRIHAERAHAELESVLNGDDAFVKRSDVSAQLEELGTEYSNGTSRLRVPPSCDAERPPQPSK